MKPATKHVGGVLLCLALLTPLATTPTAAQSAEERFVVELSEEGDAVVSVTFAYDLESETEQAAFEELKTNETAQMEMTTRFENRMTAVAEDASTATDREMAVGGGETEFERNDNVGLMTLSVTWSNLAAVEEDQLTVTEPFASGFEPDRQFIIKTPEETSITSAEPEPSTRDETSATWAAGTSLSGFEVVVDTKANGDGEATTEDSPGFGVTVAIISLFAAALFGVRNRRD